MKKFILAAAAAALMSGTAFAGNIGVTMANTDTFLTVLQKGIEKAAKDAGQPVQVEIAENDVSKQLSQVQNFIAAKVDAIIEGVRLPTAAGAGGQSDKADELWPEIPATD